MAQTERLPRGVHLCGTVPLANAEDVFRTVTPILGDRLRRMPDGETGERLRWIQWQNPVFARHPAFEEEAATTPAGYGSGVRFRLRAGVSPSDIVFDRLGYANAARESYATFSKLKQAGVIPSHCRFQVNLPTPMAVVRGRVAAREQYEMVLASYMARMFAEVDEIAEAIPRGELAFQWDTTDVGVIDGREPPPTGPARQAVFDRLVELSRHVPADAELGYHLCYGDLGHQHFKEPGDTAVLVEFANSLAAGVERPLNWIHMPVPIERSDDAYFAPLRNLHRRPETELYLGLVHFRDGIDGARRRIAAAQRVVADFGVATECGFGRRPPERGGAPDTLLELLRLHAAVSAPL